MRITMVIPSLGAGGAERAVQRLSAGFLEKGHKVSVVTTSPSPDFYALPEGVTRVRLWLTGAPPGSGGRPSRVARTVLSLGRTLPEYWRAISATTPDIVVAQLEQAGVLTLLSPALPWPVVVVEQNDPRLNPIGLVWRVLRRLAYRRAACVVSVSEGVDNFFGWLPRQRRRVIHNPVDLPLPGVGEQGAEVEIPDGPFVIAMGRLVTQKGFDLLLRAFQSARATRREWRLVILGEGPEREALEDQARRLGLADAVLMLGTITDPRPFLQAARGFALSSRWEGFPMALLEAMSLGVPSVSFACPSGPSEIITDGKDGLLVRPGDVEGFACALGTLMDDDSLGKALGEAARSSVSRFSVAEVVERWEREVFPIAIRAGSNPRESGESRQLG